MQLLSSSSVLRFTLSQIKDNLPGNPLFSFLIGWYFNLSTAVIRYYYIASFNFPFYYLSIVSVVFFFFWVSQPKKMQQQVSYKVNDFKMETFLRVFFLAIEKSHLHRGKPKLALWLFLNLGFSVSIWRLLLLNRKWNSVWVIGVSALHHTCFSFLFFSLSLCFYFISFILIYFSWGAHIICRSTRSVLMGVFDCNRPLYLLYCSNKKKVFGICHWVLLVVYMSTTLNLYMRTRDIRRWSSSHFTFHCDSSSSFSPQQENICFSLKCLRYYILIYFLILPEQTIT